MSLSKIIYKVIGYLIQDRSAEKPVNIKEIRKVLVVNLQGMGDFLMTTPLIRCLAEKYRVDVLVSKKQIELIATPEINKVIVLSGILKTRKIINDADYDLILLANGAGPKSALYFSSLESKYKASHVYLLGGYETSFSSDIRIKQNPQRHRTDENLCFLKPLGIDSINPEYIVNLSESQRNIAEKFHNENKGFYLLGIHPGGDRRNTEKRYPIDNYCELANRLDTNVKAVFFLGPDESGLEREIEAGCKKG